MIAYEAACIYGVYVPKFNSNTKFLSAHSTPFQGRIWKVTSTVQCTVYIVLKVIGCINGRYHSSAVEQIHENHDEIDDAN